MAKSSSSSSSSSTSSSSSSHSSGTSHRKGARMERRHRKGLKKHRHGKHFQQPHHQYDYLPHLHHHHHHHGFPNHYVNKDDHHFPSPPAPEFPQCAYHVGRIIRSKSLEKKPKIKKARKLHRRLMKQTQKLHVHKRCPFTFPPTAGYVSDFIDYGDPLDNRHQHPPGCCLHQAGHGGRRHRAGHDGNHHGRSRSTCGRSHGMSPPSHPVQDADHHKALIRSQVEMEKPSTSTIPAQADVPAGTGALAIAV